MEPTEHELTVAVESAARRLWESNLSGPGRRSYDDVDEVLQQRLCEEVLPIVTAVIHALPDRGRAARLEIARRVRDRMCLCGWEKTSGTNEHDNWCPASVVDEELLDDPAEAAPHRTRVPGSEDAGTDTAGPSAT